MSELSEPLIVAGLPREYQQPRIVHRLNVWELPDRTHSAEGVRVVQKCGCKIIGGGTCPHPFEIKYCSTHAAVTNAACERALKDLQQSHEMVNNEQANLGAKP